MKSTVFRVRLSLLQSHEEIQRERKHPGPEWSQPTPQVGSYQLISPLAVFQHAVQSVSLESPSRTWMRRFLYFNWIIWRFFAADLS